MAYRTELHPVVQLEFAEGVLHMVLDRAVRDHQAFGDLLVREPLGDQPQHLGLPVGELRRLGFRSRLASSALAFASSASWRLAAVA
ncbi:hypothetical protein SBADM41S_04270 [Streptomyces badius]